MKPVLFFTVLILFFSCSSQPKNSGDVFTLRSLAEKELELGNNNAARGNHLVARELLNECRRKAVLTDDPNLIIRSTLSFGNVLLLLGQKSEASEQFEYAQLLADKSGNSELVAASRIYNARAKLIWGSASAQSVLDETIQEASSLKNRLYIAFSWQLRGQALRELGSYSEAEAAYRRSLEIHEKDKYLENASYDWYTIASIRSLAGNTAGALQALEASIALDRRMENSWGLAASWRAIGDVYRKAERTKEAADAYKRARSIYAALGNEREASEIDKKIER